MPIAHRTSVFELTPAQWADTRDLLLQAKMALHDLLAPDGYLLGWNQGGALHPICMSSRDSTTSRCLTARVRASPGARHATPRRMPAVSAGILRPLAISRGLFHCGGRLRSHIVTATALQPAASEHRE